ncbi:MAG TPA: hypothetical protein VGH08_09160 [Chthoniobacterales bacterium]
MNWLIFSRSSGLDAVASWPTVRNGAKPVATSVLKASGHATNYLWKSGVFRLVSFIAAGIVVGNFLEYIVFADRRRVLFVAGNLPVGNTMNVFACILRSRPVGVGFFRIFSKHSQ